MKMFRYRNGLQVPGHDSGQAAVTERPTSPAERRRLACQYAALVFKIARKIHNWSNTRRWGTLEDVFQEGMIGLYRALDGYDPAQGAFMNYAYTCIYRHLSRTIVEGAGIIKVGEYAAKASEDELDEKFNAALALAYKRARHVVAFEPFDNSNQHCNDYRWDEQAWRESLEEVQQTLRSLKERQADIIKRRLGLEGDKEETLEEVGQSYGISKERARQIEAQALVRLKNWLLERDPDEYDTQVARSKMFTSQLVPHPIDGVAATVAPEPNKEVIQSISVVPPFPSERE